MTQTNEKQINLELQRIDGNTYLSFKISPAIEKMFAKQTDEVRESVNWKNLKFYFIPDLTTNYSYKRLLNRHELVDDFGATLYAGGAFNIAFLRTVGGEGKIRVPNTMGFSVVSLGMDRIMAFLKEYYSEYLRDYKVTGHLTLDI